MNRGLYSRRRRGIGILPVLGWLLLVGLGVWLTWYGFTWSEEEQLEITPSPAAASGTTLQATVRPTATSPPPPTATSVPIATPLPPTPPPPLPTPYIVAGADGVNVRDGPDITHTRLGHLDPGAQAALTGQDGDWWRIQYDGAPGWVYGELVATYNYDAGQVEPTPTTPAEQTGSVPIAPESWPQEVFQLINAGRAEQGLPPYTYNETLELAAQLHGEDCYRQGECSHTGSDGSDVKTRVQRAGYDAAGATEVIVYSSSPQAAVDWWMDETPPNDPHRSTLLSTWVTEIGVAVVPTGRGNYYFIADFGRPNTP